MVSDTQNVGPGGWCWRGWDSLNISILSNPRMAPSGSAPKEWWMWSWRPTLRRGAPASWCSAGSAFLLGATTGTPIGTIGTLISEARMKGSSGPWRIMMPLGELRHSMSRKGEIQDASNGLVSLCQNKTWWIWGIPDVFCSISCRFFLRSSPQTQQESWNIPRTWLLEMCGGWFCAIQLELFANVEALSTSPERVK